MSVQFGTCNFDGRPTDREYLASAEGLLAPYGPDGGSTYVKDGIGILFRALHTTKESRSEAQPHITPSSAVLAWDGRLDNRDELVREFGDVLDTRSTDVSIVAAAYERWGTACFAKLLGDWAVSIWNPTNRSLILAKDPIGTRHLYYSLEQDRVSWSTILDPLVLLAGRTFTLEEEYIAGWLSFFPATHLTPYVGIHSVPPSATVLIRAGKHAVSKYWDFDPTRKIRYRTDAEYEEQFRVVFGESVRRRLRSNSPILAELSGGMDSSSIVCVADAVIAKRIAEAPRLDTVSYHDDFEPGWDERPFFTKVEEKRGRAGCHIDLGSEARFLCFLENEHFVVAPDFAQLPTTILAHLARCVIAGRNRVLLSGIGGDEFLGGVPTPKPELADLVATGKLGALVRRLALWALYKRKPWLHLLLESCRPFLLPDTRRTLRIPWLRQEFVGHQQEALRGYDRRWGWFAGLPSFQENVSTLEGLRRQLGCSVLMSGYERRYPYLDRSLLEFLFAIPREQLVRPGRRRSLMRRALAGMVPTDILERRRKASISRAPRIAIHAAWPTLLETCRSPSRASRHIFDADALVAALDLARKGQDVPMIQLIRTLAIQSWLRASEASGMLAAPSSGQNRYLLEPGKEIRCANLVQKRSAAALALAPVWSHVDKSATKETRSSQPKNGQEGR
jgi:asparagine synthase (glutamine-hydrolysing)